MKKKRTKKYLYKGRKLTIDQLIKLYLNNPVQVRLLTEDKKLINLTIWQRLRICVFSWVVAIAYIPIIFKLVMRKVRVKNGRRKHKTNN